VKVCVVTEREYGCGASIAAFRLARSVADVGHEVHYVFSEPNAGAESQSLSKWSLRLNRRIWNRMVRWMMLRVRPEIGLRFHFSQNRRELGDLLNRIEPDVINLHNVGSILSHDAITSLGYRYPVVWTMHDFFPLKPYCYRFMTRSGEMAETTVVKLLDSKAREKLLLSSSNIQFVTPSKWMRDSLLADVAGEKEIHVIPNGLFRDEFFPEDTAKSRERLGIPKNGFYLLFVASRLEYERKNIQVLLDALELVKDPSIHVLALGSVSAEFKGRYPLVRWFDSVFDLDRIRAFYSAADVFVITSLVENFPNTILESLFCGTPVVGTNTGGIPELVVSDTTGWLFNPLDPEGLAEILMRVRRRRELLWKVAESCVGWVQARWNIEEQRDRYLQLFKATL